MAAKLILPVPMETKCGKACTPAPVLPGRVAFGHRQTALGVPVDTRFFAFLPTQTFLWTLL